jgi:pimeloyl-ACP methyl ester carboxylesterase
MKWWGRIGDIVGLVDALGAKQAVITGHDIGAAIAWQTALLRPDRFRAVIALSPPFRSRGFGDAGPPTLEEELVEHRILGPRHERRRKCEPARARRSDDRSAACR